MATKPAAIADPQPRRRSGRRWARTAVMLTAVFGGVFAATAADAALTEPAPATAASTLFSGRSPRRLADTRRYSPRGAMRHGNKMVLQVGTTRPVVLNTVAVQATGTGFLTLYPCGQGVPSASTVNLGVGTDVANSTVATPNSRGQVCVYSHVNRNGSVHVVIDYFGTFSGDLTGKRPSRIADTRTRRGRAKVTPRSDLQVAVGSSYAAAALNVTVTEPERAGHLTVYPCNSSRPNTSNVNFVRGEDRAGFVLTSVGRGLVCIHTSTPAHIVVDSLGTVARTGNSQFITPRRVMDTRSQYGRFNGRRGRSFSFDLTSIRTQNGSSLAARRRAVVLNVTMVNPDRDGYLTVYPCSSGVPSASAVNAAARRSAAANAIVVQPDSSDRVCIKSNAVVDVVVDIGGFLNPMSGSTTTPSSVSCRQMSGALTEINRWRQQAGVAPLSYSGEAYRGAVYWATQMLKTGGYDHSTRSDSSAAGVTYRNGEVLSQSTNVTVWRASPSHFDVLVTSWMRSGALVTCTYTSPSGTTSRRSVGWFYQARRP